MLMRVSFIKAVAYPGGGSGCSNTPLSIHFINYSLQSVNVRLAAYDAAQIAPAPSEKTITGAASSRYALVVYRTSEQSAAVTDEHARTKWAGQFARGSSTLTLRAVRLCQSSHIQWLAIPPGFFDAKYHVIASPSKILWGRLPPPPPPPPRLPPPMAQVFTLEATPTHDLRMRKNYKYVRTPPFH